VKVAAVVCGHGDGDGSGSSTGTGSGSSSSIVNSEICLQP